MVCLGNFTWVILQRLPSIIKGSLIRNQWPIVKPHSVKLKLKKIYKLIFLSGHTAKDPRFWQAPKPDSDTLARLYGLVRGCPEVIGTQLPVIRAQCSL